MSASKIGESQLVAREKEGPYSTLDAAFIIIHPATAGDSSCKKTRDILQVTHAHAMTTLSNGFCC